GRVRFSAIYPGIDLAYYGVGRELEFDLIVSPEADLSSVRLAIDHADRIWIDAQRDLNIDVRGETMILRRPVAYQERDGKREPVEVDFVLRGNGEASLQPLAYDHDRALTIDPVLSYATFLGGTKSE